MSLGGCAEEGASAAGMQPVFMEDALPSDIARVTTGHPAPMAASLPGTLSPWVSSLVSVPLPSWPLFILLQTSLRCHLRKFPFPRVNPCPLAGMLWSL